MKARVGFVSNSSSSSFIVTGEPPRCNYYAVTNKQAAFLRARYDIPENEGSLYITELFSDGAEEGVLVPDTYIDYYSGNHGHPYAEWLGKDQTDKEKFAGYVTVAPSTEYFIFRDDNPPILNAVWMPEDDYYCRERKDNDEGP